jgi:hypothetical protein
MFLTFFSPALICLFNASVKGLFLFPPNVPVLTSISSVSGAENNSSGPVISLPPLAISSVKSESSNNSYLTAIGVAFSTGGGAFPMIYANKFCPTLSLFSSS